MAVNLRAQDIAAQIKTASGSELDSLLERYADDPRKLVQSACKAARKQQEKHKEELIRIQGLYSYMYKLADEISACNSLSNEEGLILGLDEVGRGSLAGPLTVAAVALPSYPLILGLDDSKKLNPHKRELLAVEIKELAKAYSLVHIEAEFIDHYGISAALRKAMSDAIELIDKPIKAVLIDGVPLRIHPLEHAEVKGDAKLACISAASILAKVSRDELMKEYDKLYPNYGFAHSKGYGSADHIAALERYGLSPLHRKSFCKNFSLQDSLF